MATTQLSQRPRTMKKLEKPRPLKIQQRHSVIDGRITTAEDLVSLIDNVVSHLTNGFHDPSLQPNIVTMCNALKHCAPQLEAVYKDQLDRAFVAIRNGSQDERLDLTTRVHLLELIELRAKQWRHSDSMDAYYSQKLANLDDYDIGIGETPTTPIASNIVGVSSSQTPTVLSISDVIKNSGKFTKPTRIPGKNYCKDEVVIRNSDSGKVNPGAKERLVQITGTSEDKIHYAKDLIKDTIQRNASPVRLEHVGVDKSGIGGSSSSLNSSASDESNRLHQQQQHTTRLRSSLLHSLSTNDASIGEYKYTITVGNQALKITGCNHDLVRTAKLVLDEHFSRWTGEADQFTTEIEFFNFDEEAGYPSQNSVGSNRNSGGNLNINTRETSMESTNTSESEETYKPQQIVKNITPKKTNENRELTYEFLLLCATGPYAKRPPADWDRIQKECPTIIRKVESRPSAGSCAFINSQIGFSNGSIDDRIFYQNHCDRHRVSY
ncbi:eukaryotic translation initiation factor 4E-binding protein Mextli isoform X3 [Diachasmimorpha longicaudata]|uniref:eukaryotic translation initiation factor 4E-binding protein Mextli isoform X3 n=1 Tax=Diachasmimorpha longicaudata TaxID=58733 RepID=UPI0030B90B9F